jgi:hypothetical protein
VITVVLFLVTMSNHADGHPPVANPGHSVAPPLGSPEKDPLFPSAPNPGTYIRNIPAAGGSAVAPLLGSLEKGFVPPSAPNPGTYIPVATTGQSAVAPSSGSLKKASVRPPPAPNGDPYTPGRASTINQRGLAG